MIKDDFTGTLGQGKLMTALAVEATVRVNYLSDVNSLVLLTGP